MKRLPTIFAAALALTTATSAMAAWPEQPITMICPFPAGGAMDAVARQLAENLKPHLPKPVAVTNRPGAAGTIGTAETVRARPDGYTIGISGSGVLTVQPHRTALPYKGPDDYAPIVKTVNLPILIAVRSESPHKTMRDLLAAAKAKPGEIRMGSPGIGTILHLNLEALKLATGVEITHVPFAGSAESVPAMLGGHTEAVAAHPSEVLGHVQAGKARVLLVFEPQRNPLYPEAPTAKELGHDITDSVYYLLIAPKNTPAEVIKTLNAAVIKAMAEPTFAAFAKNNGFSIDPKPPDALRAELTASFAKNGELVRKLGLVSK